MRANFVGKFKLQITLEIIIMNYQLSESIYNTARKEIKHLFTFIFRISPNQVSES